MSQDGARKTRADADPSSGRQKGTKVVRSPETHLEITPDQCCWCERSQMSPTSRPSGRMGAYGSTRLLLPSSKAVPWALRNTAT